MSVEPRAQTKSTNRLRILIYDRDEVFRVGLRVVLQSAPDLLVVGTAESPAEAIAMSQSLDPRVVLVSNDLQPAALDLIEALHRRNVPVVSIGPRPADRGLTPALAAGARVHLSESVVAGQLIDAVRTAARGE